MLPRTPPTGAAAAAPGTAAATTASTSPAVPTPAAPPATPAGPPPPKPDIPVVAAAKARKKIPFWAFATLSMLPLWAFMYVRALTPAAERIAGPLGDGAEVYTGCSSCHGSRGEGGVGYQFSQGEVLKTFPHIEDQLRWVDQGTDAYVTAGVEIYGDPNRAGGAHVTKAQGRHAGPGRSVDRGPDPRGGVPRAVHARRRRPDRVPNERSSTSGAPRTRRHGPRLEDGSATFDNIDTKVPGAIKVGTEPAPGSSAGT